MSEPQHSPLETLAYGADTGGTGDASAELRPGDRVGKYFVLDVLGRGAMGVVHRAFDPQLERTIALKIVRPAPRDDSVARARLLAEARALARLSHPNVVTVYEVGEHEQRVFVAMELIDGIDLARWLKERPRSWQEIVAVFIDAGQGLVAVHEAGLVHRDIKPANILCGRDGRARVGDFGIARAHERRVAPSVDVSSISGSSADEPDIATSDESLTADGLVVGTPAFMAPEQHFGQVVGPAADQYAFCVALYEALYRQRPFDVAPRALPVAKLHPPTQPPASDVPRWLWPLVARGLQPAPDARHPSMAALVRALREDPVRRRRRYAVIAGATVLLAGGVALAVSRPRPCTGAESHLEGVWDDTTRASVGQAFERSTRPYATATWRTVADRLDDYAHAWVTMHRDACEATRVRGEQSEALLDRRVACLESRRRGIAGVVDVLAQGEDDGIDHAIEMIGGLPSIERCADLEALQAALPPPDDPDERARVASVRDAIARGHMLVRAGRYEDARIEADAALESARAIDHPPLTVEALAFVGESHETLVQLPSASAALEEAVYTGLSIGHDEVVVEAVATLTWISGERQRAFAEAERWGQLGRAVLQRAGDPAEQASKLLNAMGATKANQAQYDAALALYEEVLTRVGTEPALQFRAAMTRVNIGNVWLNRGDLERAAAAYERSLVELDPLVGAEHPKAAMVRGLLAMVLDSLGEHTRAIEMFELAATQIQASLGATPELANILINEAMAMGHANRHDEVIPLYERAIAILEHSPDQSALATVYNNLGEIYYDREVFDAARRHYERSLAILERALGPSHPDIAFPLIGLARVLDSEDRHDEAIATYERVLKVTSGVSGASQRPAAVALLGIAQIYAEQKRFDEALATLDREQRVHDAMPFVRADDRLTLATVRVEVLIAQGDPTSGLAALEARVASARDDGIEEGRLGESELTLSIALAMVGRKADAREMIAQALSDLEMSPANADRIPVARRLQAELNR